MKEIAKMLGLTNTIWVPVVSVLLIVILNAGNENWDIIWFSFHLITAVPFFIAGIITLRNIETPEPKQIQAMLILVSLIFCLPSIALPFAYEIGGLVICLLVLVAAVYGVFKLKDPVRKMVFINSIGIFSLVLNLFMLTLLAA